MSLTAIDFGETRLQRLGAERVEPRLVREAGVEIADLLRRAARLLVAVARQLLDERVEIGFGLVASCTNVP